MKSILLCLVTLIMLSFSASAQKTSAKFKVYGNCGMCEERIEKAAMGVDGVSKADWYKETKMMKVTFDSGKTNLEAIHQAIANVGHDTDLVTAKDEVYNSLHSCCLYERPKNKKEKKDKK